MLWLLSEIGVGVIKLDIYNLYTLWYNRLKDFIERVIKNKQNNVLSHYQ